MNNSVKSALLSIAIILACTSLPALGQEAEPAMASEPAMAPEPALAPEPAMAPEPALAPEPTLAPEQALAPAAVADSDAGDVPEPDGAKKSESADGALDRLVKSKKIKFEGSYGLHYTYMPTFGLDETGADDGLRHYLDHRLKLRPSIKIRKDLELLIDVDLLAGQLAGSTTDVAESRALYPRSRNDWTGRSMLRELTLTWNSRHGRLQVGQVAAQWGMGLVYNSGRSTDRDWTDNLGSDMIERISFDFAPLAFKWKNSDFARAFRIMLAGDVVFKDQLADLMDEDHAYGFSGAVYFDWNPEKALWRTFTGIHVNYRWQDFHDGFNLRQTTVDFFTEHEFRFRSGDSVKLELEAAVTAGESDRQLHLAPSGFDIAGWGMALRGTYDYHRGVRSSLEFGLASGDGNPMDGKATGFSFDPSYQVGMILFQDVLARSAAWGADRAARHAEDWLNPPGWQMALTDGAVTNALYIHPQFKFYPAKGLDMRLGFLWARALVPVTSYYNLYWLGSSEKEGNPVSFKRAEPSKDLGIELDAGIWYTTPPIWKTLAVRIGVAGGWCLPGEVFSDSKGKGPGNLFKVRVGIDIVI